MTPSKQSSMTRCEGWMILGSALASSWHSDTKLFDKALLKMASGVSTSPTNALERMKDLLSVLPGLIEEFDRKRVVLNLG